MKKEIAEEVARARTNVKKPEITILLVLTAFFIGTGFGAAFGVLAFIGGSIAVTTWGFGIAYFRGKKQE